MALVGILALKRPMADQLYDGEPKRVAKRFRFRCCDCGLVHSIYVRQMTNGTYLTVWRRNGLTNQVRKLKKYQHVRRVKWPSTKKTGPNKWT